MVRGPIQQRGLLTPQSLPPLPALTSPTRMQVLVSRASFTAWLYKGNSIKGLSHGWRQTNVNCKTRVDTSTKSRQKCAERNRYYKPNNEPGRLVHIMHNQGIGTDDPSGERVRSGREDGYLASVPLGTVGTGGRPPEPSSSSSSSSSSSCAARAAAIFIASASLP